MFFCVQISGVDIPALLQSLSISETIIDKLKDSSMGHVAIAYMCYKVMTPVRYTVTLGKIDRWNNFTVRIVNVG